MPIEDYRSVEFGVCATIDQEPIYYRVPIDVSVKGTLVEMLEEFYSVYLGIDGDADEFLPSEKYSSTEKLHLSLAHENLDSLRRLYRMQNIPISNIEFSEIAANVSFYFGIFHHRNGTKQIAIKRPATFKALLKKKLLRFVDDTLSAVEDDIFKLDTDFDFVIHGNNIDILHPSGFIFISDIDEEIMRTAVMSTQQLQLRIEFVNFNSFSEFVGHSKTAAKLVASIKSRNDLEQTTQRKLLKSCRQLGVLVRQENGQIVPEDDYILDFLQILDRREYTVDLTDNTPEIYIAGSRKQKN